MMNFAAKNIGQKFECWSKPDHVRPEKHVSKGSLVVSQEIVT